MRRISALVVFTLLGACGQENPPPPPPPPGVTPGNPGVVPQPVAPQPVAPGTPVPGTPTVPGAPSQISLTPGFVPDPHIVRGSSGGAIQASNLNPQCTGWIAQGPNHLFNAGGNFSNLRFIVNGGNQDTTLVVQKPDGTYACNDDAEGRNPIVQGPTTAGVHRIWVGSYTRNETVSYTLGLSELVSTTAASLTGGPGTPPLNPTTPPGAGASQLDTTGSQSNFGQITLTPGFTPDPHVANGTSGGSIDASTVSPGCMGYVARIPDHIFQAGGSFGSLRVLVHSTEDTTLVVRKPDGTFLCNDDSEGLNPMVSGSFPPGQYRIWVGSYAQGQNAAYRVGFSELSSVTPNRLAQ